MMKNAIVTGAGRYHGIGAEICRMLSSQGYNLFITSNKEYDENYAHIDENDVIRLLRDCNKADAIFRYYDLGSENDVVTLFDEANSILGNIDVLINCMCYYVSDTISFLDKGFQHKDLQYLSESLLLSATKVNLVGPTLLSREFINRFNGSRGRIVLLSSTQELEHLPNEMSYAITKASIPVLVKNLSIIAASKNITINALNPGFTDIGTSEDSIVEKYTSKIPFHRVGSVKDVANTVKFLVSSDSDWITGQTINSEGGIMRDV